MSTDSYQFVSRSESSVPRFKTEAFSERRSPYALVIPVLNEGQRIRRQLERIAASNPSLDIVIADGGSTDHSTPPALMHDLGVRTLLTKLGPGKLSAQLRMAFWYCLHEGYVGMVTMDGNDKDCVEGAGRIVEALESGFGFVQGSRYAPGGEAINTPFLRSLAVKAIHAPVTSIAARHRFTDTTNGYRGFSSQLVADPRVAMFREVFDTYELLAYLPIRASRLGYRVCEVPVKREYPSDGVLPTKITGHAAHIHLLGILARAAMGQYSPREAGSKPTS